MDELIALPITVPNIGVSFAIAYPSPPDISMSPLLIVPRTLHGTRPINATATTCLLVKRLFIKCAGWVDTMPATRLLSSDAIVTSASPPNSSTVPDA